MIIGIDPGLQGAIAVYEPDRKYLNVFDMPIGEKRGSKNQIDVFALAALIEIYAGTTKFAVVEDVGAMAYTDKSGQRRGQGAAASFAFGQYTGVVHGVLAAFGIRMVFVRPSVWKMAMGINSEKRNSIDLASRLMPEGERFWTLKKHDGRAEAALLALFGAERIKL